jgi:hypothetical protein
MKRWHLLIFIGLVLPALAACSRKQEVVPASILGQTSKPGAMLAYEHTLSIKLPSAQIPGRVTAAREACDANRFGACTVLGIEQKGPDATLLVRIVPSGVEPLTKLAAQDGVVASRESHAEDLADAVQDTQRKQALLDAYAAHLEELASRKDLAVSDLIALAHERAQVQTEREGLLNQAAQQKRRIETNLLTLRFNDSDEGSRGHRLGASFRRLLDELVDGVGDAMSMLAYGLPFLLLLLPVCLLWLWAWRRLTARWRRSKN